MPECTFEGDFRGEIISYGLWEPDGGAVAISCTLRVSEVYDRESKQWHSQYASEDGSVHAWVDAEIDCEGDFWIISNASKGNKVNEKAVKAIMAATGWNGDIQAIASRTWEPNPCAWSTESETYNDKTRYKAAWIKPYESTPGGGGRGGNVDPEKARALQNKYGSQFRALAGSASKPAAPTTPPPKMSTKLQDKPQPLQGANASQTRAAAQVGDEEIPF